MQPRIHRTNAGRAVAFLRRPSPRLSIDPSGRTAERPDGEEEFAGDGEGLALGGGEAAGGRPPMEVLRRTVARLEGRVAASARLEGGGGRPAGEAGREAGGTVREGMAAGSRGRAALALGVPAFDGLFARGGLPLCGLTELRTDETRLAGATTGFIAALMVRISALRRGPVLWVREARVPQESGRVAALGFLHIGVDPGRLLVVTVRQPAEALWAIEEGLGCPGLAAVVGELQGLPKALDLTASRRLALRARAGGVPVLLAGHGAPASASAAVARLRIEPGPSRPVDGFDGGPGFPSFLVTVEKNRDGRTGRAFLEWNSDERRFSQREPVPVGVAAPAGDGPPRPGAAGQVVAHPGAGRRAGGR